jgi:hypothetical protein
MRRLLVKPRAFYINKIGYSGTGPYEGYWNYKYELYSPVGGPNKDENDFNLDSEGNYAKALFNGYKALPSDAAVSAVENGEVILGIDYFYPDNDYANYDNASGEVPLDQMKDLYYVVKIDNNTVLYSLSYDDFALSYVYKELLDLDSNVESLKADLNSINSDVPVIREDLIDTIE